MLIAILKYCSGKYFVYNRKRIEPRIDLWRTPPLIVCLRREFPSKIMQDYLLLNNEEIIKSWLEIPLILKIVKKAITPNPIKSLCHLKCYSLSNTRNVKLPNDSAGCNCLTICSQTMKPYSKSEKSLHFSTWSGSLFTSYSEILLISAILYTER